ncbi:hypothetical protein J7L00_07040 [Candidatus Bathyarchaeota archaeon]|nr:hypothetical protein [Candidatus Bathyarchaeota archaeon]
MNNDIKMESIALKSIKYALMLLLILNFILPLIITLVVNQEAWFFGYKLGGIKACSWLLTNGIIGLVLAYSLLKDIKYSFLAVFLFFLVNFVNVMMIPLQGLAFSPFYSLGLILSLIGVVLEVRK